MFEDLMVGPEAKAVIDRAARLKAARPAATRLLVSNDELDALLDYAERLLAMQPLSGEKFGSARHMVIHEMTVCTADEPEGVDLFERIFNP